MVLCSEERLDSITSTDAATSAISTTDRAIAWPRSTSPGIASGRERRRGWLRGPRPVGAFGEREIGEHLANCNLLVGLQRARGGCTVAETTRPWEVYTMPQTIEVDDDLFAYLKHQAEPFVDTPNTVLRRLLDLDDTAVVPSTAKGDPPSRTEALSMGDAETTLAASEREERVPDDARAPARPRSRQRRTKRRAAPGSILAEAEYEMPLLQALADAGGSGCSRDIVEAVGKLLSEHLTPIDREPLKSGAIRWENRIQFVRLKLIERGWMEKITPRGTWAISEEGRQRIDAALIEPGGAGK